MLCILSHRKAKALFDCDAEDDCELSFNKDEILYNGKCGFLSSFTSLILSHTLSLVHESDEPDWLQASKANGKKGLVPENYVEFL